MLQADTYHARHLWLHRPLCRSEAERRCKPAPQYQGILRWNTTYYRFHHGERLLTPEQQKWIINLFRRYGYTEECTSTGIEMSMTLPSADYHGVVTPFPQYGNDVSSLW
ncbi:DUF6078 family protein [Parabacteroides merdae]|uniref:DUF6078 family protein n=1 Tax=Parabacteroides merdae TaxID=46503 RepID=UPI002892C5BE|nr:DUF6078 family protein [Parabacteroides merdae]